MSSTRSEQPDVVITHPNRDNAEARATRALTVALMVASAVMIVIISVGGYGAFSGAQLTQIALGVLFAYYAYSVANWRSGVLPIAAGTSVIAGIFAAVSVSTWFQRGGEGYDQPLLPEAMIGALVLGFAVLQLVALVVAMRAFMQQWHVELEVPRSEYAAR